MDGDKDQALEGKLIKIKEKILLLLSVSANGVT